MDVDWPPIVPMKDRLTGPGEGCASVTVGKTRIVNVGDRVRVLARKAVDPVNRTVVCAWATLTHATATKPAIKSS